MWGFRAEPNAVAEAIRQGVIALVGFGVLHWTTEQQALLLAFVSAALSLFVRSQVTTESTLRKAGTTKDVVEAVAVDPYKTMQVQQHQAPLVQARRRRLVSDPRPRRGSSGSQVGPSSKRRPGTSRPSRA